MMSAPQTGTGAHTSPGESPGRPLMGGLGRGEGEGQGLDVSTWLAGSKQFLRKQGPDGRGAGSGVGAGEWQTRGKCYSWGQSQV